jgi:hypothetical protein
MASEIKRCVRKMDHIDSIEEVVNWCAEGSADVAFSKILGSCLTWESSGSGSKYPVTRWW